MNKIKSTQIIIVVVFIVCMGVFGYLILRELGHMNKMNAEIVTLRQEITIRRNTANRFKDIEKSSEALENQYETIRRMLPEEPLEEELVISLQQYATETSTQLTAIEFEERLPKDAYTEIPMQLSFSGSYKGFLKLLKQMLYGERLLRIDTIQINSYEDTRLKMDIKATSFCTEP